MNAKLRVATLGCKVNQYETELVRQGLQRAGDQGNLEQGGVIQTGIDTAADEAEHPLPVVEAHHAHGLE